MRQSAIATTKDNKKRTSFLFIITIWATQYRGLSTVRESKCQRTRNTSWHNFPLAARHSLLLYSGPLVRPGRRRRWKCAQGGRFPSFPYSRTGSGFLGNQATSITKCFSLSAVGAAGPHIQASFCLWGSSVTQRVLRQHEASHCSTSVGWRGQHGLGFHQQLTVEQRHVVLGRFQGKTRNIRFKGRLYSPAWLLIFRKIISIWCVCVCLCVRNSLSLFFLSLDEMTGSSRGSSGSFSKEHN